MHLEHLHEVPLDVLAHLLLRLRARERNVALLQERRDVPLRDLRLRLHAVLHLAEPLRREPQLGLPWRG